MTRSRLWQILEPASAGDTTSRIFDITVSLLIASSVVATILQSVPEYDRLFNPWFSSFELICIVLFSIEYLLRVWASSSDERFRGMTGPIRYMLTPMAVIDLLAILPGLLSLGMDLRVLRSFRMMRLFRLGRYNRGMRLLGAAFRASARQLYITFSGVLLFLLISSSLLYYVERDAQPEAFRSIPSAMWWGVCTLTTVGYGDVYPITATGKFLAGIIALLGIGAFALPAGIIAANFQNTLSHEGSKCPHCGKRIGLNDISEELRS